MLVLLPLLAGCPSGDTTSGDADADTDSDVLPCSDVDGDGYGAGAGCLGPDCDESDADLHDEAQCDAACDVDPTSTGCACDTAEPMVCYSGVADSLGVGTCRAGLRTCTDGVWGECDGQVLPHDEICDGTDDDCDGEVDDGVLSPCGTCDPECSEVCIGAGCPDGFDADDGVSVVVDADGALTLGGTAGVENPLIWIANNQEGSVSKLDTRSREETARYRTGPGTEQPARTTVNPHGDVVVANRDDDQVLDSTTGSVTKILASDCVDANGDGFETSTGGADLLDWGDDDCVAWRVGDLPGARGTAFEQSIGLDGTLTENVWVGVYTQVKVIELDSEDGSATGREIPNVYGYGLALGPDHALWAVGQWWHVLWKMDTESLEVTEYEIPAGESSYGLTVDAEGRPWIGGTLARFDPGSETWASPGGIGEGLCVAADAAGNVWTASRWGHVYKVDVEDLTFETIETGGNEYGWAVDFDGFAWGINIYDNSATVIDPDTNEFETVTPPFVFPYSYSDMTGFQLVNATNPVGVWTHVFEGCEAGGVAWTTLSFDADAPVGTSVAVRVRTADTLVGLATAPWLPVATVPDDVSPVDLAAAMDAAGIGSAGLLEVEVTLRSIDRDANPRVRSVGVEHTCGGGVG